MLRHSLDLRDLDLLSLFIDSLEIQMCHFRILSVENLGHFLQCNTASLDEENYHENHFKKKPALESPQQ